MNEIPYSSLFSVRAGETFTIKNVPFLYHQEYGLLTPYSFTSRNFSVTLHTSEISCVFYDYDTLFPHIIIPSPAEVSLLYSTFLYNLSQKRAKYEEKVTELRQKHLLVDQLLEKHPELVL